MKIRDKVICPYCSFENFFIADSMGGRELYNCFLDNGGCDRTFLVEYRARITARRIEGEGEAAPEPKAATAKIYAYGIGNRWKAEIEGVASADLAQVLQTIALYLPQTTITDGTEDEADTPTDETPAETTQSGDKCEHGVKSLCPECSPLR